MQTSKKIWKAVIVCLGFLIFVMPVHAESVSLSWNAPTTNEDNTPLTDLAGFKVYYGTATGNYGTVIDVGMTLCYVVGSLSVGTTYYFAATAYDS